MLQVLFGQRSNILNAEKNIYSESGVIFYYYYPVNHEFTAK